MTKKEPSQSDDRTELAAAFRAWPRLVPSRAILVRWTLCVTLLGLASWCGYAAWNFGIRETLAKNNEKVAELLPVLIAAANLPKQPEDLSIYSPNDAQTILRTALAIQEANRQVAGHRLPFPYVRPEVESYSTALILLLVTLTGLFTVMGVRQAFHAIHLSEANDTHRALPLQYLCWARFADALKVSGVDVSSFFEAMSKVAGQSAAERTAAAASLPLAAAFSEIAGAIKTTKS